MLLEFYSLEVIRMPGSLIIILHIQSAKARDRCEVERAAIRNEETHLCTYVLVFDEKPYNRTVQQNEGAQQIAKYVNTFFLAFEIFVFA